MEKFKIWLFVGKKDNNVKIFFNFRKIYGYIFFLHYFSLGPLVCKVKDHQVEFIVDTLCNNMIGDNEQLRDISSIGLKTVINELIHMHPLNKSFYTYVLELWHFTYK